MAYANADGRIVNSTKQNISLHINNIFKEGELMPEATVKDYLTVQMEGDRSVRRRITYYNLDVIISVGYRVKSPRGTQFRIWANRVLKEYLLKGYVLNPYNSHIESRLNEHDRQIEYLTDKVDFFVRTSLPPVEGIFYDGQVVGHHGRPVMSMMKGKSEEKIVAVFVLEGGVCLQRIVRQQRHDFLDFLLRTCERHFPASRKGGITCL